jgi:bifunctional ADP-heptose synthase (sugar kinase/adenylyltransferase)
MSTALPMTDLHAVQQAALAHARRNRRAVFVTLAEDGIIGALPSGEMARAPSLPVRGTIDIVGAGDCVTANLAASLAAGAALGEALACAMAASSVVVHQLGTTGTATCGQISELLTA